MAYADESPVRTARRRGAVIAIAVGGLGIAALATLAIRLPITSDRLRARVVSTLEDRLDSDVELERLSLRLFPRLHAEGYGLTVRHKHRRDVPPLITVRQFSVDADLVGIWRRHVAHLRLDGFNIQIPPGDGGADRKKNGAVEKAEKADEQAFRSQ